MATNATLKYTLGVDFSNITDNGTNATGGAQLQGRNEFLAKFEIAVLGLILYLALFGNIVVIVVLCYRKRKLSRMQLFIIHLALADISVGLCQVLPQLIMDITYRFDGNNFLCKLVKYLQVGTMYGSTYVLIMTALDRYMSICHPLTSQTWTTRRVHLMVLIAWTLSGLFAIPQLIIFSYKPRSDGIYDCLDNFDFDNAMWELQAYITWIFVSIYMVPFIILTTCYTKICYVVWVSVNAKESTVKARKKYKSWSISKSGKFEKESESCLNGSPRNLRNPRAHTKRLSKSKIKTVKMTLTVIICFLVCWAPFFITQMWSAFDMNAPYYTTLKTQINTCVDSVGPDETTHNDFLFLLKSKDCHIMAIAVLLASLNSCTNPWIYLAFSGRVCTRKRRAVSKTWSSANSYMESDTMRMRTLLTDNTHLRITPERCVDES